MSVDIKKRFDRVVDILIQLQSKRIVKAQELADRFDVSLRTIYRDIKSLEQAGIPLIAEAGTGYSIMEGYKLPPVMFNKQEALSFVTTEKLAEKFLDKQSAQHYQSAMLKIKAILKGQDKDLVSSMEGQIVMQKQSSPIFLDKVPHALSTALESISNKKQLKILYQGIKDNTGKHRTIEPIGIFHEGGFWYIVGYCLIREDFRQFRSDRIHHTVLTEVDFSGDHISIGEYLEINKREEHTKTPIKIRVDKTIANYIKWERNHYGFSSEKVFDKEIEMNFLSRDIENEFPRWIMMFADKVTVLEPKELKNNLITLLQKSISKQNNSENY